MMHRITGTNTWDYCDMIDEITGAFYRPSNRMQRRFHHKTIDKPDSVKSLKSSKTSLNYFPEMTALQRLWFSILVITIHKSAAHQYVRNLKMSNNSKLKS